jgi:hypothetical protein
VVVPWLQRIIARLGRSPVLHAAVALGCCLGALCVVPVAGQSSKVDTSAIGPRIGQPVPDFSGADQFGQQHTLASSMGAQGVMLVFFRSADW